MSSPMTPPPSTTTDEPGLISARSMPCRQQPSGSQNAPCVGLRSAGSMKACFCGRTTYSAKPPSRWMPMALRLLQRLTRPAWQWGHRPQAMLGSPVTRSPTAKPETAPPTASTMPENSCPSVTGGVQGNSPWNRCRSVPQTPQASIRTRSSSGPGAGLSTSRNARCCRTALQPHRAFMASLSIS